MFRQQLKISVILVCLGAASGLFDSPQAQAWWGGCCGGGGWFGGGGWGCGGGCCGGRVRFRLRCRCHRRSCCGMSGCGGCDVGGFGGGCGGGCGGGGCGGYGGDIGYGGYGYGGGMAYGGGGGGGCGCNGGGGGYATGGYGAPGYGVPYNPGVVPQPTPYNGVPTPAAIPPGVPPTPEDYGPAPANIPAQPGATPAPPQSSQSYRGSNREVALQTHRVDSVDQPGVMVYVPEDATVFVNGTRMKTTGTERRFSGEKLQPGKTYEYEIRAEMVRNGVKLVRSERVQLRAGEQEEVAFDFSDTVAPIQTASALFPETNLTLHVPEDASVYLDGEDTISVGKVRKFVSQALAPGKSWKDYEVRVEVERDGKTVVQTKKISLYAGDNKQLEFHFNSSRKLVSAR